MLVTRSTRKHIVFTFMIVTNAKLEWIVTGTHTQCDVICQTTNGTAKNCKTNQTVIKNQAVTGMATMSTATKQGLSFNVTKLMTKNDAKKTIVNGWKKVTSAILDVLEQTVKESWMKETAKNSNANGNRI